MASAVYRGKPDVENPRIRFDVVEVVPEEPRRGFPRNGLKALTASLVVCTITFMAAAVDVIVTPVPQPGHGSYADSLVSAGPLFSAGSAADSESSSLFTRFMSSADSNLLPFFSSERIGFLLFLK